jgi:hypothetical protein
MSPHKLEILRRIIVNSPPNALRSKVNRKELAVKLADSIGSPVWQVESFVHEMAGLNFYNVEDRLLFIQFAECGL